MQYSSKNTGLLWILAFFSSIHNDMNISCVWASSSSSSSGRKTNVQTNKQINKQTKSSSWLVVTYLCTGKSGSPAGPAGSPLDRSGHTAALDTSCSGTGHSHAYSFYSQKEDKDAMIDPFYMSEERKGHKSIYGSNFRYLTEDMFRMHLSMTPWDP